jgi:fucose permease
MPIAGRMSDRIGPGRIVLAGLVVVLASTFAFTQVTATTSFVILSVALYFRGVGLGMTMMPAMSAAYQVLDRAAVPRATTTLNILNRVGGALGTAILAVMLQTHIQEALVGLVPTGTAGADAASAGSLPAAARETLAPALAGAFADTFWWAMGLTALALLPAMLLPMGPPAAPQEAEGREAVTEREPVFAAVE